MSRCRQLVVLFAAVSLWTVPMAAVAQDPSVPPPTLSPAALEVWATEAAFARTMAARDHAAFVSFLADEAVFLGKSISRGKAVIAEAWRPFSEGAAAPFSWRPERVEVLDSGGLAFSTGPVFNPAGVRTGTFMSVWRKESDGKWRIVFDSGCPPCQGQ